VPTPDLYEGVTVAGLDEGVAHAQEVGFGTILERGRLAAERLPNEIVYAGFSLGVMPPQMLAQTRPGGRGALFFHAAAPPAEFGGAWPEEVPLQIHMMEGDPWVTDGGDLAVARGLAEAMEGVELFLYPGDRHLFADSGLADYDESAAALLEERVSAFSRAARRFRGAARSPRGGTGCGRRARRSRPGRRSPLR
jgi:Dienelactone hydrolase family